MKQALVIRHVPFEDLGNLQSILDAHGYRVNYSEAGLQQLTEINPAAELLIVLGGPIGAYEEKLYPFIEDELALLRARLREDRPTLGVCLGAQLMARALGAKVYPGSGKEIGWKTVTLTENGRRSALRHLDNVPVLHWHGDTFDLPAEAVHLASTGQYPNQAFSWRKRGLALQFHAEAQLPDLERWYIGHACEIGATPGISVITLRAAGQQFHSALQKAARDFWNAWLSEVS